MSTQAPGNRKGSAALRVGRRGRLAVQLLGFLIGLGLLGWCITLALAPENRQQFQELRNASALQIGGLLALSLAYVVVNGLIFWIVLRPARRLPVLDVLAVNGIATFLTYLPFKLSAVVRVAIHNRRDRVPLLTIGSWFVATAVLMLIALGPAALAAVVWRQIDFVWLGLTALGQLALGAALLAAARAFRGDSGQSRLAVLVAKLRVRALNRALGSRAWSNVHSGFDMLSSPQTVAGAIALRLMDVAVQAARFALAAAILGVPLSFDQALLISLAYFMIGILSPVGVLGAREAGATGTAAVLFAAAGADLSESAAQIAPVALFVSATEGVVLLFGAAAGVAWLRPDRLLKVRAASDDQTGAPAAPLRDPRALTAEPVRSAE